MPQDRSMITTMHTAYYYDADGRRNKEAGAVSAYESVNNYGSSVINGKKYYQVSQDGRFIRANNVDGVKREMLNDAKIYNNKGQVIPNSETLEAGSTHTTYGKPLYLNGSEMYRVGKGQYIKKDDAGPALGYGDGIPENHIKSKKKTKSVKKSKAKGKSKAKAKGKSKAKGKGKVRAKGKGKRRSKVVKGRGKKKHIKRPKKGVKKDTAASMKYTEEITADMQNATAEDIKNNRIYAPNWHDDGGKDKINGRGFESGYNQESDLADYIDPNTHRALDPNMGRYYAIPKVPSPTGRAKQYYFNSLQAAEKEANLNAPSPQDRGMLVDLWAPGAANDPRYNHGGALPTDNSLQQAAQAGNTSSELQGINIAQVNPSLAQANAANPTGPQLGA